MEESIPPSSCDSPISTSLINGHARLNGLASTIDRIIQQHVYVFSANDRESLERQISKVTVYVKERPVILHTDMLDSLAFTLGQRRSVLPWKLAFSAPTPDALIRSLTDPFLALTKSSDQPRIGFLFTGQGSQWANMGRELFRAYPVYASAIRKADDVLRSLGASWSLIIEMGKAEEVSNIDRPYISQPARTALQIALVDLLRSWGVRSCKVVGHSSGEIAAAYSAGILDMEVCMALAYWRGVACINSPSSMTVSGDEAAILELQHLADKRSVWNRRLKIDVAYHSHHMLRVAEKYGSLIGDVHPNATNADNSAFFSSLAGRQVNTSSLTTAYWVENLTSQVRFREALELLYVPEGGDKKIVDLLIEVGPHSALQGPARQVLESSQVDLKDIQYCSSLIRGGDSITDMQRLAARLFKEGCRVEMGAVNFPDPTMKPPKVLTDLPTYQWNHSRKYWYDTRVDREGQSQPTQRHDLLGNRVHDSSMLEPQWKNILKADSVPWLRDHKVEGLIVFPMAGYLCMAMEAYRQQAGWKQVKYDRIIFSEISVHQALPIPESTPVELMLSMAPHAEGPRASSDKWSGFKVFSWTNDRDWVEHCRGLVASESSEERNNPIDGIKQAKRRLKSSAATFERLSDSCTEAVNAANIYNVVAEAGFEYGPTFRYMDGVMTGPSMVRCNVTVPDSAASMPYHHESEYTIHPITLDLIFQSLWPIITNGGDSLDVPYMPIAIQRMEISTSFTTTPGAAHQVIARLKKADLFSQKPSLDIDTFGEQRLPETADVSIRGLIGALVQGSTAHAKVQKAQCLKMHWEPCVSYLNQTQCSALFSLSPPAPTAIEELWSLERLSCDYIEEALDQTAPHCITAPHLKRLYIWMKKQISLMQEGRNCYLPPELLRKPENERQVLRGTAVSLGPYGIMIQRIGENLSAILQGHIEPLSIMLEDNLLSRFYTDIDSYQRRCSVAANYIQKMSYQNPALRLLEIGAGTASATMPILEALGGTTTMKAASFEAYHFTDITSGFFETAKVKLSSWGELISYRRLDIESSPTDQDFQAGSYDVVVASDVLHATAEIQRTMVNVRSLLKPGGKLVLIEETGSKQLLRWLPFATLPGWWLDAGEDTDVNGSGLNGRYYLSFIYKADDMKSVGQLIREDGPLLTKEQWTVLFSSSGFSGLDGAVQDYPDHPEQSAGVMFTTALPQVVESQEAIEEIVVIGPSGPSEYVCSEVNTLLQNHSQAKVTKLLMSEVADFRFDRQYCILIDDPEYQYLTTMNSESFQGLQRILQCPGVLWINGSLSSPDSGLVTGLCRTIRSENPNTNLVTLAIEDWNTARRQVAPSISDVFERSFCSTMPCTEIDTEFAEKNGLVCIPRYEQAVALHDCLDQGFHHDINYLQPFSQSGRPLKLTISNPGFLDTLCFVDDEKPLLELADDEIEIDIKASGLNFKDVILALGQLSGNHLGQECSGVVK